MNYSDYDFSYLIPPAEVFDVEHDSKTLLPLDFKF